MTQAVNLANFANNLDSSGGVSPSALNAATPIAKGGTNATTVSAARTNLGVDYTTLVNLMYPVGSIYTSTVSTNPATLFGTGTWTAYGAGRVLVGIDPSDASFDVAGETGGSKDATVVSHTHTATSTVTDPGHNHTKDSYGPQYAGSASGVYGLYANTAGTNTGTSTTGITVATSIASTGSSGTNANLQPYVVVYMWTRTA